MLGGILRTAGVFLHRIYYRADFLLHEFDLSHVPNEYGYPLFADLEVHVVESDNDACRLAETGYEDFRPIVPMSTYRLRSGAVGFCAYIDRCLVHIAWVGLTDRAKRSFDPLPYAVDFDCGEGVSGGSWTFPAYRGRGIHRYVMWHRLWYLREHGCKVCRNSTAVGNTPSIKGQAAFPSRVVGILRVIRLLGVQRTRVRAMDDSP